MDMGTLQEFKPGCGTLTLTVEELEHSLRLYGVLLLCSYYARNRPENTPLTL